jgi:isoquinoline 1-oxidoreductase beta subunit
MLPKDPVAKESAVQESNRLINSSHNQSRRDFLRNTTLLSGGLTIAIALPGCSKPEQAAAAPQTGKNFVAVNAWLHIGYDSKVTFLCDRSEMGQGVFTALPTLIAEELGVDPRMITIEFAPPGAEFVNSLLGVQATGGSTSVRDAWQKLRMAGAEARERLLIAGAKALKSQPNLCRIVNNGVATGDKVALFGQLVDSAAALPKPQSIKLTTARDFKYIGTSMQRFDTPAKVDGSAQFGIDVRLPGMLYAALAQSPVLGGSVKTFKADKANGMPGVRAVLQTSSGVVVVADGWWQAKKARDVLDIQWDAGLSSKLNNAAIFAGLKLASDVGKTVRHEGDVDAAFKSAAGRVEAVYELPMLAHATLEPQNCTVEFRDDGCHVYAPTQVQQMAQSAAAKAAGLPESQVYVHTTFLGGGYGRRLETDFIGAAVEAAKHVKKPVKLLWTREDDMTHDYYRPPARDIVSGAFGSDNRLSAFKLTLVSPSITSRWAPGVVANGALDPFAVEAAQNFPYNCPNVQIDYVQHEIGINVGYWRSVSHALNCFVVESFIDELANDTHEDPYVFRRNLLWKHKEPRWQNVLDVAARKAGWGEVPKGHFQGIALMSGYETFMAQVAEVSVVSGKLKVHRIVCVVDCGQIVNRSIVEAQAEGSIVFGLTAALFGEINIENGQVKERNFDSYRTLRINEIPRIDVHFLDSNDKPGGMGEPAVALVAPAVCNAIHAATGKRLRSLPIVKQGYSV